MSKKQKKGLVRIGAGAVLLVAAYLLPVDTPKSLLPT